MIWARTACIYMTCFVKYIHSEVCSHQVVFFYLPSPKKPILYEKTEENFITGVEGKIPLIRLLQVVTLVPRTTFAFAFVIAPVCRSAP